MERKQDANIGINWQVISDQIEDYLEDARAEPPFERFLYQDKVYLIRMVTGFLVAGYDLQAELTDPHTGLPKTKKDALLANDIAFFADDTEMTMTDDDLFNLI